MTDPSLLFKDRSTRAPLPLRPGSGLSPFLLLMLFRNTPRLVQPIEPS
jgi:hypothetical protein